MARLLSENQAQALKGKEEVGLSPEPCHLQGNLVYANE
jgi:hypothetical protein